MMITCPECGCETARRIAHVEHYDVDEKRWIDLEEIYLCDCCKKTFTVTYEPKPEPEES